MKKLITVLSLTFLMAITVIPVAALTVSVSGGSWDYGVNDKTVWSYYYHAGKTHKSSVVGYVAKDSGWISARYTSKAEAMKSMWTNKSYYDIK